MAWKGVEGDQRIWWSRLYPNATTWTTPQPVAGAATSVGPALAFFGDLTYMAWKGVVGDQAIWWSRLPLNGSSWSPPQPVSGASTSFRPALVTIGY